MSLSLNSRNGGTLPRRPGIAARGLKRQAKEGLEMTIWIEYESAWKEAASAEQVLVLQILAAWTFWHAD